MFAALNYIVDKELISFINDTIKPKKFVPIFYVMCHVIICL